MGGRRKAQPDTKSGKPWDQDSRAAEVLEEKIENGTINLKSEPKTIWLQDSLFQDYNLTSFRGAIQRHRSKRGIRVRGGNGKSSQEEAADDDEDDKPPAKARKVSNDEDIKPAAVAATPRNSAVMMGSEFLEFTPIHAIAEWTNADLQTIVSVAVLLPSGVVTPDASKVRVSEDQFTLEVTAKWPPMMSSVSNLHAFWNQQDAAAYPATHPCVLAFHQFFSALRDRENDELFSTASIYLGGERVMKNIISLTRIGTEEGERILFVDLQRVKSVDYKESPDAAFAMVKME